MGTPIRIGWIGTGVMGLSMAGHLIRAGHSLSIHSRTRARAEPLLALGAQWAASPSDAAADAAFLFSMVSMPADVESVHLGPNGTLHSAPRGSVLIDMTTSTPALAAQIAERARAQGVAALDAPVTGGDIGAREARLSIMVGGDEDAFSRAEPLLRLMGKTVIRHGPAGNGQLAKAVNQILIASTMVGVVEGLAFARRSGLDPHKVLESVGAGAAGSWTLANLAPRMLRGDFAPGFRIEHFVKDLGIALEASDQAGLDLPGTALAHRVYTSAVAAGLADRGTHALAVVHPSADALR
ncbi:MAG: NAD(P)-dependent oxidoreductase [Planctomycetes bacterium]|nr:NAD(P)-dependent oxidoreductase [Planctomycetota bacterium]